MHSKAEIAATLETANQRILALIEDLDVGQLQVPYHPGINPPLWEGGHAAFFYEAFLLRPWNKSAPILPDLDNVWDSFDIDHDDRWAPGVVPDKAATLAYMRRVHDAVLDCLARRALSAADLYLYKYAIFHQFMHVESMIWARQTLGYPPPPFAAPDLAGLHPPDPGVEGDTTVPAGRYLIGMAAGSPDYAGDDFAFDNEKPGFEIDLPAFRIARTPVTNRQFLDFVEAGGYRNEAHWSWGGRKWLRARAAADPDPTRPAGGEPPTCPIYWKHADGGWWQRRFDQWQPLPPAQPVMHVCYWEAEAYCRWAGRRLPSEFEWEVAALGRTHASAGAKFPWGERMQPGCADLDATALGQLPASALAAGDSPFGCRQMLGTAWEWTASQFLPYPGFSVDMYPYMSTLQFGYHKTVKGGSCATASALIRGTYRQAYLPQRRDVFVGFRTCALGL